MINNFICSDDDSRLVAEGFLSYIKGCSLLALQNIEGTNGRCAMRIVW